MKLPTELELGSPGYGPSVEITEVNRLNRTPLHGDFGDTRIDLPGSPGPAWDYIPTRPSELNELIGNSYYLPPLIPIPEVRELPPDEGYEQFRLAQRIQEWEDFHSQPSRED